MNANTNQTEKEIFIQRFQNSLRNWFKGLIFVGSITGFLLLIINGDLQKILQYLFLSQDGFIIWQTVFMFLGTISFSVVLSIVIRIRPMVMSSIGIKEYKYTLMKWVSIFLIMLIITVLLCVLLTTNFTEDQMCHINGARCVICLLAFIITIFGELDES